MLQRQKRRERILFGDNRAGNRLQLRQRLGAGQAEGGTTGRPIAGQGDVQRRSIRHIQPDPPRQQRFDADANRQGAFAAGDLGAIELAGAQRFIHALDFQHMPHLGGTGFKAPSGDMEGLGKADLAASAPPLIALAAQLHRGGQNRPLIAQAGDVFGVGAAVLHQTEDHRSVQQNGGLRRIKAQLYPVETRLEGDIDDFFILPLIAIPAVEHCQRFFGTQ